jgi:hypothetical protein
MTAEVPGKETTFKSETTRRTASFSQLLGGMLPNRSINEKTLPTYKKVGHQNMSLVQTTGQSGDRNLFVIAPPMTGLEVFDLLHFTAPSKTFGYDLDDLLRDWSNLYDQSYNAERLERHRTIPGWEIFERDRNRVLETIRSSSSGDDSTKIAPVIQVGRCNFSPRWQYEQPAPDLWKEISGQIDENPGVSYVFSLGPALLGSYSPEITDSWKKRDQYGRRAHYEGTQDMGSTQSMVMSIRYGRSLFRGNLFKAMRSFVNKGELPTQNPEEQKDSKHQPDLMQEEVIYSVAKLPFPLDNKKVVIS